MKFLCLILLMLTFNAFAKRDIDMSSFNHAMMQNIQTTLKHNPQTYEQNEAITRRPASVAPVEHEAEQMQERSEKLEDFHEQITQGKDQW